MFLIRAWTDLVELFNPQKISLCQSDLCRHHRSWSTGVGADREELAFRVSSLNQLSQMDGFVHVVRCFENFSVPHPSGSLDPIRDIAEMDSELTLNDLIAVERKLERLVEEKKKSGGRDKSQIDREIEMFERFERMLSAGSPLRDLDLSPEDERTVSGFGLLTLKPILIILNLGDGAEPPELTYSA